LKIDAEKILPRLAALETSKLIVREILGERGACSALPSARRAEVSAAERLAEVVRTPGRGIGLDLNAAVDAFEKVTGVSLAVQQRRAVEAALVDKCTVITGGPGVGKTTIVKAIVHLAKLVRRRVALAAPTGRAAKRLREATVHEATTIHRLLEFQPRRGKADEASEGGFTRNRAQPLDVDMVIIDEGSMVDTELFASLLDALPPQAQLVLVGDVDQLPSVGAGAVLADTIASEAATVIRLTEIFRQAAASKIIVSAHAINQGQVPDLDSPAGATSDFYFIARDEPLAARDTIVELVAERIRTRFGFDPISDVQVLAPMHRSDLGTEALNTALQAKLNPPNGPEIVRGDRVFRRGDRVMQRENDYDKGVFNGDIGILEAVDATGATLAVDFDGKTVMYERNELGQLIHAYAISIHKSQGSEYPAVVLALATQHFRMLQRSLLYTAVTRGKKLVVIVGSKRALGMAVKNADAKKRYTWLAERVRELLRT
jgi:exodeoxyribonuclease V alpha subunit